MTDLNIKNSNIDSNNVVKLRGTTFTLGYKKFPEVQPLQAEVGTAYKIGIGQDLGIEIPVITVNGVIDVDDYDTQANLWSSQPSTLSGYFNDGVGRAGYVTLGYLNRLWRDAGGDTYLNIPFGDPTSQKEWTNYANTSTAIAVKLDSYTPTPMTSSQGKHLVAYQLTFKEIRDE